MKHLIGGGPGRRDVLTECCLMAVVGGSLVKDVEDMDCPDCRRSLVARGICPECESDRLVWAADVAKTNNIVNGMLSLVDVEAQFYLGCEECSETLIHSVSADEVAVFLTKEGWRP